MKADAASNTGVSPAKQRLVETMSRIRDGYIETLTVRNGEPSDQPPPRITRELRMKPTRAKNPPSASFELKDQVLELFRLLRRIDNGVIRRIDIQDGLPFRVQIEGLDETPPHTQPKTEARP